MGNSKVKSQKFEGKSSILGRLCPDDEKVWVFETKVANISVRKFSMKMSRSWQRKAFSYKMNGRVAERLCLDATFGRS